MANEKRLIDLLRVDLCEVDISDCTDVEDILSEIITYLYEQPEVDAAPVVHGCWIDRTQWIGSLGRVRTECSVCGTIYQHKPGSRGDGKGGKFCEECGAKMDGGNTNG